jgi:hypothetical protein
LNGSVKGSQDIGNTRNHKMTAHCLNCQSALQTRFCGHCGQKATTHRFSLKAFILHDLLHGIWHLDKGIIHTLKTFFISPAPSVQGYIQGRRVNHYNFFALYIIVVAIKTYIDARTNGDMQLHSHSYNATDAEANRFFDNYYKLAYLLFIPLMSFFSFLIFKRLRYNFTEHLVLNCYTLAGGYFFVLLFALLSLPFDTGAGISYTIGFTLIVIFSSKVYVSLNRKHYSTVNLIFRMVLLLTLMIVTMLIMLYLVIIVFYGGSFHGSLGPGTAT